jgi:uncharacterized protein (TIGR02147 family)
MLAWDDVCDYRELFMRHYSEQKQIMPLYSYRIMGERLGLDASQLFRILHKNEHLPTRCIPMAKDLLGLTGRAGKFFETLLAASKTRTLSKKKDLLDKAFALRDVERQVVGNHELRFFSQWWIPVILSYLEVSEGRAHPEEITERIHPHISKAMATEAIEILKSLGFVKKLSSGRLGLCQTHLTAHGPEKILAVRTFQKEILSLAANALDSIPVNNRDISTLTLAIDESCFADIREMTREYRRQVQKRVEESVKPDRVMQLSMAFFPVVLPKESIK